MSAAEPADQSRDRPRGRWHRLLTTRSGAAVVLNSVIVSAVIILVMLMVRSSPPYIVVDADTEFLAYRVVRPELASVPLVDARMSVESPDCAGFADPASGTITALLTPDAGAVVQYRWSPTRVSISLKKEGDHVGVLRVYDESVCDLAAAQVRFDMPAPTVESPAARPLPIAGPAEIGTEFGEQLAPRPGVARVFDLNSGGTLKVFGRATLPPFRGSIYPAGNVVFPIPAGSRVTSGSGSLSSSAPNDHSSWYGTAEVAADGFRVSITTETDEVFVFRPGFGSQKQVFSVGLLARMFGDPSVAFYSVALVVFTVTLQIFAAWTAVWRQQREIDEMAAEMAATDRVAVGGDQGPVEPNDV